MILPIGTVVMQLQANPQLPPVFPSPSATPVSERSLLSAGVNAIVARAQAKTGGTLGVVIVDLGTGVTVERNGDAAFPLASVHKLALAVCAYAAIDAGALTTDETVELTPSDIVRTVSPIATEYARGQRSYAVRELIARMLLESDNTAADALYRLLGGAAGLNDRLRALGIDGIVYRTNEAGLIEDAANGRTFARGGDNAGTPASVASLLGALETGHILSPTSRSALLATLDRVQTSPGRLRSGFPPETDLAHKTGTSETIGGTTDATNDAGIARVNRRSIVIVAMLAHARGTSAERDGILASVARLAYDATRLFPMR